MTTIAWRRLVRSYAALAGAMDFATGIALVLAPAFAMTAMGAGTPPANTIPWVRFVGIFVAAVGASYLWAAAARAGVLRAILAVTIFFRAGAGLYTGVAVSAGWFERAWLVVTVTDLACVALQAAFLMKGAGPDE